MILDAVVTEDAAKFYAQFFGGVLAAPGTPTNTATPVWDPRWKYIRWGEGGWIDRGSGAVPRDPSPSLRRLTSPLIQDLDAVVDGTRTGPDQRYPAADGRAVFQKAITYLTDVVFEAPSTVRVRALLDYGEFNADALGNPPEVWELGIFSDHPTISGQLLMVAYATMPGTAKTAGVQIERFLRLRFGRA